MKISTQSFFIVLQSLLTYLGYIYLFKLCHLKMKTANKQLEASLLLILMKVKVKVKSLSLVRLFATLWTVGHQAPESTRFPKQEYWSGLPFRSPGNLSNPEIKLVSPAL